jgi:hypothetical protein
MDSGKKDPQRRPVPADGTLDDGLESGVASCIL